MMQSDDSQYGSDVEAEASGTFRLAYVLTVGEFVSADRFHYFRHRMRWLPPALIGAACVLSGLILCMVGVIAAGAFFMLYGLPAIFYPWLVLPLRARMRFNKFPEDARHVVCTISPDYLDAQSPMASSRIETLGSVEANSSGALACMGPGSFMLIPARACASAQEFETVVKLLRGMVGRIPPSVKAPLEADADAILCRFEMSKADLREQVRYQFRRKKATWIFYGLATALFVLTGIIVRDGNIGFAIAVGAITVFFAGIPWFFPWLWAAFIYSRVPGLSDPISIVFSSNQIEIHSSISTGELQEVSGVVRASDRIFIEIAPNQELPVPRRAFNSDLEFEEAYARVSALVRVGANQ